MVEPGPPPIIRSEGIVLINNGADDKLVYRTGIAVFDRTKPAKVISRSDEPVFESQEEWEEVGQVPNVLVFQGLVRQCRRVLLYYGGTDKYIGVAEANVAD